ncbi:MAG: antibiotic biosynthesis monooxygenase family protein, partial [Candidatus Acidiferrum sp.]
MAKRKAKKSSRSSSARQSSRSRAKKSAKPPKDAVALVVMMHAKPGQELLLQAELSALIHPTRKEEGCILYDLHRSTD